MNTHLVRGIKGIQIGLIILRELRKPFTILNCIRNNFLSVLISVAPLLFLYAAKIDKRGILGIYVGVAKNTKYKYLSLYLPNTNKINSKSVSHNFYRIKLRTLEQDSNNTLLTI